MAVPTFDGFSLQDSNFITERIEFKSFASREVIRAKINRREGVKLLGSEFGEKEIKIDGIIVAESASALQTLIDSMKTNLQAEEGSLIVEAGRTFRATVLNLGIPDEHYNQSKAPFSVTFICSDPFAEGDQLTVVMPVTSGLVSFSGYVNISGTYFARPTVTFTPAGASSGQTHIKTLTLSHTPTGQTLTVSGFGSGLGLDYSKSVTINMEDFTALEGVSDIGTTGSFMRWAVGGNNYTVTVSGRFTGGSISLTYKPRYI